MGKFSSVRGLLPGLCLLAGAIVLYALPAKAAGEWEWTAGQGWIQGAGVSRPTPKEQLNYAYGLEQRGEFMDASRNYFLLIQNFPSSEEAGVGLQRLARCLYEMENYYTSYRAIEQVIETYPNTGRMSDLVEIELRIAKKMMVSETPDILSDSTGNVRDFNIRRALEIINSVIDHDPYGPIAAEAYLVRGEGLLFINDVNGARAAFETIRDEFPRSEFLERARLGLLTCDSLMGQATPQEWQEQAEVVRQAEQERADRAAEEFDELDDVEGSIRQLAEIEAAKMMDQAEQYRKMGTKASVESSKFLYREVVRRYPETPQAEDAMEKLGTVRTPPEPGRIARTLRNININPFTFNRDPEPPWIVPQMNPEDMVVVDAGLGPISGVPETAAPLTSGAAGVRPAGLAEGASVELAAGEGGANFSPASAAPTPAPGFIDGTRQGTGFSGGSSFGGGFGPGFGSGASGTGFAAAPGAAAPMPPGFDAAPASPNPLPSISETDLIGAAPGAFGSSFGPPAGQSFGGTSFGPVGPAYGSSFGGLPSPYAAPAAAPVAPAPAVSVASAPLPDLTPMPALPALPGGGALPGGSPPTLPQPPSLGAPTYHTPYTDLIGPTSASLSPAPAPQPAYGYGEVYTLPEPTSVTYAAPAPQYAAPAPYTPTPYVPAAAPAPSPAPATRRTGNTGWTMGEDFR